MRTLMNCLVTAVLALAGAATSPALLAQNDEAARHREDVVKALSDLGTPETVFDSLGFAISGPVVVLQGFTINGALAGNAKAQVEKIDWVTHVIQQVELLPVGPQMKSMREDILDILQEQVPQAFPTGTARIRIGVDGDGVVTLVGSIERGDEKRYEAALEQIERVTFVDSVEDKVVRQAN